MSTVTILESMIGLTVKTLQGNREKIIDVTGSGYKLATRRSMVKAKQLVKRGKTFIEIERPASSKMVRDTGQGYVEIVDPELYEQVYEKPMSRRMIKELGIEDTPAKSKKSSSKKTSSKKSSSKKAEKTSSKSSKKSSSKKTSSKKAETKAKKLEDLELLGDYGLRVPEGLRSVVQHAIEDHLANFNTPGPVHVKTEMDVFEFIGDDGAVGAMQVGIFFDVPQASKPLISDKTMSKVKVGLWEKNEKLRAVCFKKFGTDFQIHDVFIDADEEEYIFAGANVANRKPVLIFHRPEEEKAITASVDTAAARLELAPVSPESEEDEALDLSDYDDLDLTDGDELDEAVSADRAAMVDTDTMEEMESLADVEDYLDQFDVNVLVDYFTTEFESLDRREVRIIKSGDKDAIVTLIATSVFDEEEGETESVEFEDEDFTDTEFTEDSSDEGEELESDGSDELLDDSDDENPAFDLDEPVSDEDGSDEAEVEQDEISIDDMVDALIDGEHITARESRKLGDDEIVELFNEHFQIASEAEEVSIDDMVDALIENELITPRQARSLSDEEIETIYAENFGEEGETDGEDSSDEGLDDSDLELTESDEELEDVPQSEDDSDLDFSDLED